MAIRLKYLQRTLVLLASTLLFACASLEASEQANVASCDSKISKNDRVKLELIETKVAQRQYYAALAYLEQAPPYPKVLKLRGDAQRNTGQLKDAYDSYRDLSLTCLSAYGHAGMAKIHAMEGRMEQAHQHMQKARRSQPTNPDIRNDYGFILLAHGDYRAAQHEFMTALQLQAKHPVAIRNMVISLILDGDRQTAISMAKNNGIAPDEFNGLVDQARQFRKPALVNKQHLEKGRNL